MGTKKIVLFACFAILFFSNANASRNVIVLVDKDLFTYVADDDEDTAYDNKGDLRKYIAQNIQKRLEGIINENSSENFKQFYAFQQMNSIINSVSLLALETIYDLSGIYNLKDENYIANNGLYDLLSRNDNLISNKFNGHNFDTTLLIVFSTAFLNNKWIANNSSNLILNTLDEYNYSNSFDHKYIYPDQYDEYDSVVHGAKITFQETVYILAKNVNSIFTIPPTISYDRKKIPNANKLQLYPVAASDSALNIQLASQTKAKIEWCKLLNITDDANKAMPNNSIPQTFNLSNNNLLQTNNLFSKDHQFPLYDFIKNNLVVDGSNDFNTSLNGQFVVHYNLIDPVYTHAVFTDTINFKLQVAKPIYMQVGLLKRQLIDNGTLIKYGNKLDPSKEWTQTELASQYTINIKIVVTIIVVLLGVLIFLIKRFLVDKKRLVVFK